MVRIWRHRGGKVLFSKDEVLEVYRRHPLQEETIFSRVRDRVGANAPITEVDLAEDDETEITDQNHVGGTVFVQQLASKAGVTAETFVLDLGSGLGGSARYLAHVFGCRVHGIDFSPERHRAAVRFTDLVGLNDRVTFCCDDLMTAQLPSEHFDVVWGQSTWTHIEDKAALLHRCAQALQPGGRVAFEDIYLSRDPEGPSEQAALDELSDCWKAYMVREDTWCIAIMGVGLAVIVKEDLSGPMVEYYSHLLNIADRCGRNRFLEIEVRAWEHAVYLGSAGVLGYMRFVAKKTVGEHTPGSLKHST